MRARGLRHEGRQSDRRAGQELEAETPQPPQSMNATSAAVAMPVHNPRLQLNQVKGNALRPAKAAEDPISSSILRHSFHFAIRSDRAKDPTLS